MLGENVSPIDFYAIEEAWTHQQKAYNNKPESDVLHIAAEVYKEVFGN